MQLFDGTQRLERWHVLWAFEDGFLASFQQQICRFAHGGHHHDWQFIWECGNNLGHLTHARSVSD
jgi:hypothetical protein